MSSYITIFCTVPSEHVGIEIASEIVSKKIGACGNLVPSLTSIYTWNNEVCRDDELLLIIKTREDLFGKVEKAITRLHPYDVPEIIAMPIIQGNKEYLDWISDTTE